MQSFFYAGPRFEDLPIFIDTSCTPEKVEINIPGGVGRVQLHEGCEDRLSIRSCQFFLGHRETKEMHKKQRRKLLPSKLPQHPFSKKPSDTMGEAGKTYHSKDYVWVISSKCLYITSYIITGNWNFILATSYFALFICGPFSYPLLSHILFSS